MIAAQQPIIVSTSLWRSISCQRFSWPFLFSSGTRIKNDKIMSLTLFGIVPLLLIHCLARLVFAIVNARSELFDPLINPNAIPRAIDFASTPIYGLLYVAAMSLPVFLLAGSQLRRAEPYPTRGTTLPTVRSFRDRGKATRPSQQPPGLYSQYGSLQVKILIWPQRSRQKARRCKCPLRRPLHLHATDFGPDYILLSRCTLITLFRVGKTPLFEVSRDDAISY